MSKLHYYEFQVNKQQLQYFFGSTLCALTLDLVFYGIVAYTASMNQFLKNNSVLC